MTHNIITTQTNIYDSFLRTGLIARGIKKEIIKVNLLNLYDFAIDKHRSIDDSPYGGGPGMILRVDVVAKAISKIMPKGKSRKPKILLLTPRGEKFDQKMAKKLAKEKEIVLIAGRFEGYDERIRNLVDEEISIGDYVLTSGDLPAMVLIDAISRHLPGFIQEKKSLEEESFSLNLPGGKTGIANCKITFRHANCLEYPQYTRPEIFKGRHVPKILLSGNHQKIKEWREKESLKKTRKSRPDLI